MKSMRKLFLVLTAMVLAGFALPSSAFDKLFTLSSTVYDNSATPVNSGGVIPNGPISIVLLDFFNQSPTGNSVINSIKVNVPSDVTFSIISFKTVNGGGSKCPAPAQTTNSPSGGASPIAINNITGAKPSGHFCLYLAATSTADVCSPATWKGFANTGNSFNGVLFSDVNNQANSFATTQTYDGCDGTLNCGQTFGNLDPVLNGATNSAISRGINTGGQACTALIPYSFDFDPTGDHLVSFITAKNGQNFSVEYVMAWAPVSLSAVDSDGDGWPDFHPRVSWGTVGSIPPDPALPPLSYDYVPGLACQSSNLSDPDSIMPTLPNVAPFNDPANFTQYKYGIDPDTSALRKAKVCIAGQEWVSLPGGMVQYRTTVIDQTDTWVKGP